MPISDVEFDIDGRGSESIEHCEDSYDYSKINKSMSGKRCWSQWYLDDCNIVGACA